MYKHTEDLGLHSHPKDFCRPCTKADSEHITTIRPLGDHDARSIMLTIGFQERILLFCATVTESLLLVVLYHWFVVGCCCFVPLIRPIRNVDRKERDGGIWKAPSPTDRYNYSLSFTVSWIPVRKAVDYNTKHFIVVYVQLQAYSEQQAISEIKI